MSQGNDVLFSLMVWFFQGSIKENHISVFLVILFFLFGLICRGSLNRCLRGFSKLGFLVSAASSHGSDTNPGHLPCISTLSLSVYLIWYWYRTALFITFTLCTTLIFYYSQTGGQDILFANYSNLITCASILTRSTEQGFLIAPGHEILKGLK